MSNSRAVFSAHTWTFYCGWCCCLGLANEFKKCAHKGTAEWDIFMKRGLRGTLGNKPFSVSFQFNYYVQMWISISIKAPGIRNFPVLQVIISNEHHFVRHQIKFQFKTILFYLIKNAVLVVRSKLSLIFCACLNSAFKQILVRSMVLNGIALRPLRE